MDRLVAANSVGFADRDTAPPSGTPQYATDGDPNIPRAATIWPAYAWNMLQDEMMAVVADAGLTPDRADWTQLLQALRKKYTAHGQCRLDKSGSNLALTPYNGNKLLINGKQEVIPAAGVSLTDAGLSASTIYYIWAYMNSGVMTLKADVTARAVESASGVAVMSGHPENTLVGMALTNGSAHFQALGTGTLSWFNRRNIPVFAGAAGSWSSTAVAPAYVELNTGIRVPFVSWNDEPIRVDAQAVGSNDTTGFGFGIACALDGTLQGFNAPAFSPSGGQYIGVTAVFAGSVTEGNHYMTIVGFVDPTASGTTANYADLSHYVTVRG